MNTISIVTSQNIELEFELGSLGDRILGTILDWLVLIAYFIVINAILGFENLGRFANSHPLIMLFLSLPLLFYDLLSEMLLNGQSVGKK